MRRFHVLLLILFSSLGLACSAAFIDWTNPFENPENLLLKESLRHLDANKFSLPPDVRDYVLMKYPSGTIPLPMDSQDMEYLRDYLSGSGYIVEFRDEPIALYETRAGIRGEGEGSESESLSLLEYHKDAVDDSHNKFRLKLLEMDAGNARNEAEIGREYYSIFNGVSVHGLSENDLMELSGLDYVKRIYSIKDCHILLSESVLQIGADDVWVMDDNLRREITGQGVKIAIVDTGIDYTHADLGACESIGTDSRISDYSLTSMHPYQSDMDYTWTVVKPGFTGISVHFLKIDLEVGKDYLYIKDSTGNILASYTGYMGDVWSPQVNGDRVKINLVSDSSVENWGFVVDKVINGSFEGNSSACAKVVDGYDFVSNDTDPMDDQGHGTHCAAIAAGNGTLKGVAPGASLLAYKVLDSLGRGGEDQVIAGIDQAVTDGADVISLSLGGSGDPDDAMSQAVDNAVAAGVVVVVAAGNDGPEFETVASPGCARKALTVGATYKTSNSMANRLSTLYVVSDSDKEINSFGFLHSALAPGGIVADLKTAGLGRSGDFSAGGFTGKIALILRGDINFQDKVENANDAGAVGAIIYNNIYGNFKGDLLEDSEIPAISISNDDGQYLVSLLENGSVTVNMSVSVDLNTVADFSSRGPSYIYGKPDILAPGVNICAARARNSTAENLCLDGSHVSLSGTSMATPHVAGAAALMLQAHPAWVPLEIKAAFENTAKDQGLSVFMQGAGEIDIAAAVSLENPPPAALIMDVEGVRYVAVKS